MKLETFDGANKPPRRKRGPQPKPHIDEVDAAYIRHCMERESLGFSDMADALGCSESHAKNVIRGERGLAQERRAEAIDPLVSPFNGHSRTLSPTQLDWYKRLPYGPLLSSREPPLIEAPRSHVSFDKIVLTAKLADYDALLRYAPLLDADAGARSAPFRLQTRQGHMLAFWERSRGDYVKPSKRYLRFHRTLNLKVLVRGKERTVAKLSIEPFRRRCKEHQGKRGPHLDIPCDCAAHGEPCPAEHFEYVPPPFVFCDECNALTEAQPTVRFEVTGLGCTLHLHTWLAQTLFIPFVDRATVKVSELHIAVDIDAPARCILPYQPKQSRNRGFRTVVPYWNHFDNVGLDLGSSSGAFSVSFYDKKAEVEAARSGEWPGGAGIEPEHMRTWKHGARIEFRVRPERRGLDATLGGVLSSALLDLFGTLAVADLRHLEGVTPLAELVCQARWWGFIASSPGPKAFSRQPARGRSKGNRMSHFGPQLIERLRDSRMQQKSIEKAVPNLHGAVCDEIVRLSAETPIDLRAIVEAAMPRLQCELTMCLETRSSSDWSHKHRAESPENAAQGPRRRAGSHAHESLVNALCAPS